MEVKSTSGNARSYTKMRRNALVVLGLTILFMAASPAHHAGATDPISQKKPQEIVIGLAIPGMPQHNCKDAVNVDPKGVPKTCVADFTEYISWFYRFFAGAVGMLAAVMILYGGYQWLTAAGNAGRVQQAKTTIYSSLIAIVLTLGTYLVLHTINPQLTNLTVRGVTPVTALHDLCSDYPSNITVADANGCDPRKNPHCCSGDGCCGSTLSVSKPDNTVQTSCIANDCVSKDKVCNFEEKKCVTPREYCEAHEKNNCYDANIALRSMFAESGLASDTMMCGKFRWKGHDDSCKYDRPFSKMTQLDWSVTANIAPLGSLDDYDLQFVDCFSPDAEDVCWEWKDDTKNQKVTKACPDNTQYYCNDLHDPNAMAGINAGCLQKKPDKRGSNPKKNFLCTRIISSDTYYPPDNIHQK